MSKGSGRRPAAVPEAQVVDNWTRTFARNEGKTYQLCAELRELQAKGGSFGVLGGAAAGSPLHLLNLLECPPE